GTIQPRKGQKEAIQAVAMLKENHGLECELNLFGYEKFHSEYVQQCKRLVKSLGIEDLVTFHGFTADTSEAMRAQDIVLCASGAESLPQAILEAMACKCLVVSTSAGGIAEVLTERTGVIVRSNSADSLTHGLLRALNLTEEEKSNRKRFAYQFVFQHCSKEHVTGELLNAYLFATENVSRNKPLLAVATNENQSNNFTPGHFPKKKKKTSERIAKAVRKAIRQSRDLIIRLIPKQIRLLSGTMQRTA
nr:glycosyltransferase family 4 protein [Pirellula sp.]